MSSPRTTGSTPPPAAIPTRRGRRVAPVSSTVRAIAVLAVVALMSGPAAAAAATAVADPVVARALDTEGRYVDFDDPGLPAAADRANAIGVAFAWLDLDGDERFALTLADEYRLALDDLASPNDTVLVVVGNGFAASSPRWSQDELDLGLDRAFPAFQAGDMAGGLDAFVAALPAGGAAADATTPTSAAGATDGSSGDGSGGGFGFGSVLLVVAALGIGVVAVRALLGRRRAREQAALDLAEDRTEIEEQLKDNADRVIALGDRVIARADPELITLYEQASAAYQEVSHEVGRARSAEEIDELDDRIDHAEWQFDVIEAVLDGRPRPLPPAPDDLDDLDDLDDPDDEAGDRTDSTARRSGRPPVVTSPRTGRTYPRSTTARRTGRRRGGLGGAIGGGLGAVLADIVLGGGVGGLGGASRRTRRRPGRSGGFGTGGSLGRSGGGLGGGVLRRGGSSGRSSRPRSGRSRPRSSGGRPLGRRARSRGARRL